MSVERDQRVPLHGESASVDLKSRDAVKCDRAKRSGSRAAVNGNLRLLGRRWFFYRSNAAEPRWSGTEHCLRRCVGYGYALIPRSLLAVPPSMATLSASLTPGVLRMRSTAVVVHGYGKSVPTMS